MQALRLVATGAALLLVSQLSAQAPRPVIRPDGSVVGAGSGPVQGPQAVGKYDLYGSGCPITQSNYCETQNPTQTATASTTFVTGAWFAIEVKLTQTRVVFGFELLCNGSSSGQVDCQVWDNSGNGGRPGTVLRQTKMNYTSSAQWNKTTWTQPLILQPGTYFFGIKNVAGFQFEAAGGTNGCYWWFGSWNQLWCVRPFGLKLICPGGSGGPKLSNTGLPSLGTTLGVDLSGAAASSAAGMIFGISDKTWGAIPLPLDLAPLGMTNCSLHASVDILFPVATDASGAASVKLPIPNDNNLIGINFYNQYLVIDNTAPGGMAWSNAGKATIG